MLQPVYIRKHLIAKCQFCDHQCYRFVSKGGALFPVAHTVLHGTKRRKCPGVNATVVFIAETWEQITEQEAYELFPREYNYHLQHARKVEDGK